MGNFYVSKKWNVPLCFPNAVVFGRWREIARANPARVGGDSYCTDCTPQYKNRMTQQGKCEHPEVTFVLDDDGLWIGKRPLETQRPVKVKIKVEFSGAVAVALP